MAAKKPTKVEGKAAKQHIPTESALITPVDTRPTSLGDNQTFKRTQDIPYAEKMKRMNALRQKHPEIFVSIDDLSSQYLLRRPTGIIELDIHLGGGFPAGGASMLSGPFNSGKSWLLWRMFAMQQRIYGDAFIGAIAHTEGAFDYDWIRRCGCVIPVPDDILNGWNEIRYKKGEAELKSHEIDYWKRKVGHIETVQGNTGEEILTGILDLAASGTCSILALDSVSSLQSMKDADKTLEDESKRAAHAQMMKQFWLRYVPQTRKGLNPTTLMMVQQVVQRDKANAGYAAKYLPDWEVKGGEASKHYKLIDLVVYTGAQIRDADKTTTGKVVHWNTLKGKAGTHDNLRGEYSFYYALNGTDVMGDLLTSAYRRGIILSHGTFMMVHSAKTRQPLEDQKYKNDGEIRERLNTDIEFEFRLRTELLASADIRCLYR